MRYTARNAPLATLLVYSERMGEEIRHMYYVKNDIECKPGYVSVLGIATTQGCLWRST